MFEPRALMVNTYDWTTVGDVWFFADTYRFYHEGLKKLRHLLGRYEDIEKTFGLEASPFAQELTHLDQMIEWGEERLAKNPKEITIRGVSRQSLRYLKAGGLLQVQEIEKNRDELVAKSRIPNSLIQAINEKIDTFRAMTELGNLKGLPPADSLREVDEAPKGMPVREVSEQRSGASRRVAARGSSGTDREIPVADTELRKRCLKVFRALFSSTAPQAEADQLDMIVREMSAVLEDRVRKVAKLPATTIGIDLMSKAFAGDPPRLVLSDVKSSQEGVHALYRGFVGFVRNEVGHKLVSTYRPEQVLQLLGFVDYLLDLLTTAKRTFEEEIEKSR